MWSTEVSAASVKPPGLSATAVCDPSPLISVTWAPPGSVRKDSGSGLAGAGLEQEEHERQPSPH